MFPIRDENPSRRIPWIRNLFLVINIAVFIYMVTHDPEAVVRKFGFIPSRFLANPFSQFHTFFTYQFLHAGLGHIIGNMWFLFIFGDNIEARLGSYGFFIFYLVSGVISCLVQMLAMPLALCLTHRTACSAVSTQGLPSAFGGGLPAPLVGASGSIAGILGAYAICFPRARIVTWIPLFGFFGYTTKLPAVIFLGIWFLYQFLLGYQSAHNPLAGVGGVAWWAHIGGFVFGLLFGIKFR